jgi:hypothetical protein
MSGLILNRRCAVCGQRYGDHRHSDDACPDPVLPRAFTDTKFAPKPPGATRGEG